MASRAVPGKLMYGLSRVLTSVSSSARRGSPVPPARTDAATRPDSSARERLGSGLGRRLDALQRGLHAAAQVLVAVLAADPLHGQPRHHLRQVLLGLVR